MIDIHTHILFGVDDGCFLPETSMEVLREEAEGGVEEIFLTPHTNTPGPIIETFEEKKDILNKKLKEENLNIKLHLGAEVGPEINPSVYLNENFDITMGSNGKYILIGPYFTPTFNQNTFEYIIYDIQNIGKIPIIAHPERMTYFREDPELLINYVNRGCLLQVNGTSLLGNRGEECKNFAEKILKLNWVTFIASDTHRSHGCSVMKKTFDYLTETVGEKKAKQYMCENPKLITENIPYSNYDFLEWPEEKNNKKSFFLFNLFKK